MDYRPGSKQSKNVQVQPPAQTIGDLETRYGATPMEFYYPQPSGIGGVPGAPLQPAAVEAYARREHGYIDPEEQRLKDLLGVVPPRTYPELYVPPMDDKRKALIEELKRGFTPLTNVKKR